MEFTGTQTLQPISAKVRLGSEIRRIPCNGQFSELMLAISQIFSIPAGSLILQYTDDEGDLVHVSSQPELEEAIKLSPNLLRLTASITQPRAESGNVLAYPEYQRDLEDCSYPVLETPGEPRPNFDNLLRIKLEMAEVKAKIHQLKREKKGMGARGDWGRWKTEKQELISRIKQLKCEHRNLGRQPCYKAQRGCGGKFRARFISSQLKSHSFVPGESFTEVFRIRNEGESAWPEGTVLIPIGKNTDHTLLGSAGKAIPVSSALPGDCVDVQVPLQAPQAPGKYYGLWRLATPDGSKFGQRMEITVSVEDSSSESEEEYEHAKCARTPAVDWIGLLDQLQAMGWSDKPKNVKLLRKYKGNLSLVVDHLINDSD